MNTRAAVNSYSKVHYGGNVEVASPHRLIDMLFEGALERITQAKGAMEHGHVELKGEKINSAVTIVSGLRESLDSDAGGEIAHNLDSLYLYIEGILSKAHFKNDTSLLDEATTLLGDLRSAWRQIG